MNEKYRVSKNILYNFGGQVALLFLGVLTTPIIIHKLGNENFGVLVLITSLVGYFSILDFGLGAAIIKNISEAYAKKDQKELKKIISTAFSTFLIIGILGAVLIICLTRILVNNVLHISPVISSSVETAFYISSLSFLISMISVVFVSIPSAFQRMDIVNIRNILLGLFNTLGTILLLVLGFNLIAIVIWNVLTAILAALFFFIIISRLLPDASLTIGFDREIFQKLFRFGGFKFISNISGQITFQLDRFLIGVFYPISFLAFYNPPLSLIQKSFSSILNITGATFPAVTESHTIGDMERIQKLYLRMSRLIAFITFPVLAIFFIGAEQLINLWLGGEFAREGAPVLRIFSIAYIFIAISAAPVVVSEGMNKPKIPAFFGALGALINLIAALILIPRFGIQGAALALLVNCVLQVPVFVLFVSISVIKVSVFDLLKQAYIKPALSALIASFISLYFFSAASSAVNLIAGLLIFGASYSLLNILFKTFTEEDKLAIRYLFTKLIKLQ